ncbi:MAG: penicillin-binding transpeptidase domain-containing protein, partial [Wenzhouxiangella sp.]|nr:penicillin-binding transpeptidase domain-containing protein [Wenzhouxiangella sp.]
DQRPWRREERPPSDYWPEAWKQDQTLVSAFRRSAVWYFRDLALEIGGERYRWWLDHFNYGNALAPDGDDLFWLNGPLTISPCEQVTFIEGLWSGRFDVSEKSLAALREVSLIEAFSDRRLYGKTGAGSVGNDFDGEFEGWLVGWVERNGAGPVAYALYVRGGDYPSIAGFRKEMSVGFLRSAGVLP